MVTGPSVCRSFRRITNGYSRQWTPTKMAASPWRRSRPSCMEPGDRFCSSKDLCKTAQYWARELGALGHEVRLMPAQYVKAYVKRNKNDAADAEAICEAVQRPTMRFVAVKTAEQQAAQLLHRGREQLVRKRTILVNALRAHLAEF